MRKLLPLILFFILISYCKLFAQVQLTDFTYRSGDKNSTPFGFVEFNNLILFRATTENEGTEVWLSDGTLTGTRILKDISPGKNHGIGLFSPQTTAVLGNQLFFIANDGVNGNQIWSTQGTEQTTKMITNLPKLKISKLTLAGGKIFFLTKEENKLQVWKSDGTKEGTVLVKGGIQIWNDPSFEGEANNLFFFTIQPEGSNDSRLWRSDGTASGTFPVTAELDGNGAGKGGTSAFTQYIQFNNELYFVVRSQKLFPYPNTVGIVKTDGSLENTVPVLGLHPGNVRLIDFADVIQVNNKLYFSFFEADYNRTFIWESNGTASGTKKIYDESGSKYYTTSSLTTDGSNLIFTGRNANDETALLTLNLSNYDKTEINTLVSDTEKPFIFTHDDVNYISRLSGNNYHLSVPNGNFTRTSWFSDLTRSGTVMINELKHLTELFVFKDKVYFSHYSQQEGQELWRSDLLMKNPGIFANINKSKYGMGDRPYAVINDKILFPVYNKTHGGELWVCNSSTKEVNMLKDIEPGSASSHPNNLVNFKDHVYFSTYLKEHGAKIWRTDGTEAGTSMLTSDIKSDYYEGFTKLAATEEKIFFTTSVNGQYALCTTDGTETKIIKQLGVNQFGVPYSINGKIVPVGKLVYFSLGGAGADLWRSDGTEGGTFKIKDLNSISHLTNVNGKLFFTAAESFKGEAELWQSDGTETGTAMVKNIVEGSSSSPQNLINYNGQLVFSAFTAEHGTELWISDGTSEGTRLIRDINPGAASSVVTTDYAVLDNILYFSANDGVHGQELWKTNGTAEGTVLVKDINQGSVGSFPQHLFSNGTQLFLSAYTAKNGFELWSSTGETSNTSLVADLLSGTSGSAPSDFMFFNNELFFYAETISAGRQLWKANSSITGTDNFSKYEAFSVYPNPTSDYIQIDYKNRPFKTLGILSLDGKIVPVDINDPSDRIYIGNLPAGIYLLVIESENERHIQKFIKR